MNTTDMHRKAIATVWWPDTETDKGRVLNSSGSGQLYMSATHHGDHDEFWIVEADSLGNEVARHNPRFVESWQWETVADIYSELDSCGSSV